MAQNTFKKQQPIAQAPTDEPYDADTLVAQSDKGSNFFTDPRFKIVVGLLLIFLSVFTTIAMVSYIFTGKADQSLVQAIWDTGVRELGREVENWLGLFGATLAYFLIFKGFGVASFLLMPLLFLFGVRLAFRTDLYNLRKLFNLTSFFLLWIPSTFGYLVFVTQTEETLGILCGAIGYELGMVMHELMGFGSILFILFTLAVYLIIRFNFLVKKEELEAQKMQAKEDLERAKAEGFDVDATPELDEEDAPLDEDATENWEVRTLENQEEDTSSDSFETITIPPFDQTTKNEPKSKDILLEIEVTNTTSKPDNEPEAKQSASTAPVEDTTLPPIELPPYDPTLELARYQFPPLDILKDYSHLKSNGVTEEELEENKNKILETLGHFKIGITKIKATIGPTVTLYEIVPDAGIKISKISNLSDDLALSLAALGVRIIAPMPGKGTIGIEVPNKRKQMVSAREVLSDPKFIKAQDMELPIAFGKTISNEVFVEDLTKMPHLLMAGATGMGKSVGINMLLASLLYKKHPSQLKIVMVDPKKVELSLYKKLERHFLAMLPNGEESVLTDTKKVIHTLNSLCIEMDTRYSLLQEANCRNLKEYNPKFIARKLNPNDGHRYLPYIVVVIDELSDLMMTAGKEIETPIARLAQLARAVGIHLVLATQRPSVQVITGLIKANFPARLSFRVSSKIDSKIILDESGSDQLVGKGDMLLKFNADTIRLQCAFIDTPEVEEIVEFIGNQPGYSTPYLLPEFYDENADPSSKEVDLANRDPKFEEAAELVVRTQQGSTSLIQRKLSLGYARSGRIMDQLEAAGIVGPPNGSKVRDVLVKDEATLRELLSTL